MTQDLQADSNPSNSPAASGVSKRKLNATIGHLATVVVSCGILMWSVFNIWLNVLAYRAEKLEGQAWGIAWAIVLIACAIPLLIGLRMLFKSLGNNSSKG